MAWYPNEIANRYGISVGDTIDVPMYLDAFYNALKDLGYSFYAQHHDDNGSLSYVAGKNMVEDEYSYNFEGDGYYRIYAPHLVQKSTNNINKNLYTLYLATPPQGIDTPVPTTDYIIDGIVSVPDPAILSYVLLVRDHVVPIKFENTSGNSTLSIIGSDSPVEILEEEGAVAVKGQTLLRCYGNSSSSHNTQFRLLKSNILSFTSSGLGTPDTEGIVFNYPPLENGVILKDSTGTIDTYNIGDMVKGSSHPAQLFLENVTSDVLEDIIVSFDYGGMIDTTTVEFSLDESFSNPTRYLEIDELPPGEEVPFYIRVKTLAETPAGEGEVTIRILKKEEEL